MTDLKEKQRILGPLADCIIDVYAIDSAIARALQAGEDDNGREEIHEAMVKLFVYDARQNILSRLRKIAMIMADGDELQQLYDNFAKLDRRYRVDYMTLQDRVAQFVIDNGKYGLGL